MIIELYIIYIYKNVTINNNIIIYNLTIYS